MEFRQLEAFLAILRHRGFSRAAEALGVAQSTISFHIKALETSVGVRLVDRDGRLRATAAGTLLKSHAARIVALREQALSQLRREDSGRAGMVNVAASTIPGEHLMPPLLAEFRKTHPEVAVTVSISDSGKATAALLAQECDLALVGRRIQDRRILVSPFATDEIVLVGPSRGPCAPSGRLSIRELRRAPLIVREEGSGTSAAVAALLSRIIRADRSAGVRLQVGSTEAAKGCVLAGLGLTFISKRAVESELTSGRLQAVTVPGAPFRRSFYVARLRGITLSGAARALLGLVLRFHRPPA